MNKPKSVFAGLLAATGLTAFILMAAKAPHTEAPSSAKPNIIYLLTDDQRADALGAMGNPIIKTPHLDQLANKGLLFKNAYVTTSICCVSRATMLSGQYMSRHGIADFSTSFSPSAFDQTYPMLLKKAGYRVGFIGKYGVGHPKDQPASSFDYWACTTKSQPDYEMKDENGNYIHHTDKVNNDIQDFLKTNDGSKPFCLSVSFKAPHVQDNDPRQFIIQPRYKSMYAGDSIAETEKMDPKYWNEFPDFFRTEENIARVRWHLRFENNRMYQESVRNYYRLISGVDEVVGKLVASLEKQGLADNTVIVFMGDNGFYLGEYGLAGKWYGHEESLRVPLIIYDPRNKALQGKTSDDVALNIDIAPTILSLAGVEAPKTMQGVDLEKMVSKKGKKLKRSEFFYEHTFIGDPGIPRLEGVVQQRYKYLKFIDHDYEQLFDLQKDPSEKHNAAKDASYSSVLASMRSRYEKMKQEVK
ncbi:arylsulfatase A-like enzyme [Dyadobacter jejuensis]|uniref:Arylsulfatase A-like enzyme n=1 Tax=Dyadobacter jejuensis TaxID=1082580 RepID=A0A316AIB5_9BACT|nr:sulfatase [Dyadobacter jejuensis]PWJ56704.1 arylsulfatase A-like enzyme [Dyadobacter jejuensis]